METPERALSNFLPPRWESPSSLNRSVLAPRRQPSRNVPTDAIPCKCGQGRSPVPPGLHYRISDSVPNVRLLSTDRGWGILMGAENDNVHGESQQRWKGASRAVKGRRGAGEHTCGGAPPRVEASLGLVRRAPGGEGCDGFSCGECCEGQRQDGQEGLAMVVSVIRVT